MLPDSAGPVLTGLARSAIGRKLGLPVASPAEPEWLREPGASFVTLTHDAGLRGCIGSLEAWRELGQDVSSNAVSAAFADPRFPALAVGEYSEIAVEVSVLTAPESIAFASRDDLIGQLRPDVDGVTISARGRRGTFLPQVWEELPDPAVFLSHLLRKAGLPSGYWGPDVRVERYRVTAFHEAP